MASAIKKAAQAVANALPIGNDNKDTKSTKSTTTQSSSSTSRPTEISLPSSNPFTSGSSKSAATPRTPRTPADEAIAYFSSDVSAGQQEEVQIWELPLEDDGSPNTARSVSLTYAFGMMSVPISG